MRCRHTRTHAHTHTHTHAHTCSHRYTMTELLGPGGGGGGKKTGVITHQNTMWKDEFSDQFWMRIEKGYDGEQRREGERISGLYSRKTEGPTTMLFSLEGGDAKGSITGRGALRPRRNMNSDKVSQLLRGSARDNLIAETGCIWFLVLRGASAIALEEV